MRKLSWSWCGGFAPAIVCVAKRAVFAMFAAVIVASIALLFAPACSRPPRSEARTEQRAAISNAEGLAKIEHIVFLIKENRSFDTYFGTFPGADGATSGRTSRGNVVKLRRTPDQMPYDIGHSWEDARTAIDGGSMSKFDHVRSGNLNGDLMPYTQLTEA